MKSNLITILSLSIFFIHNLFGQSNEPIKYQAGFRTIVVVDSSRIYKMGTEVNDPLHYRSIELDIWYPSLEESPKPLKFGQLYNLLEKRSSKYGEEDFEGLTQELALFTLAEMGIDESPEKLLQVATDSYHRLNPLEKQVPVVIYMAGFNGMGFENHKVLERLAKEGFLVVSVWSVGRYPGNMSNKMPDMMEQVMDAEQVLKYVKSSNEFSVDTNRIGLLGMSWGGMSSAVLVARNPEIKAFLSFDGSEVHYFGDLTDVDADGSLNDDHLKEIIDANILKPERQHISYLYLESDKKLEDLSPTSEYNYHELLNSNKRYFRFTGSEHADFTCLPSILSDNDKTDRIHQQIIEVASRFFKDELQSKNELNAFLEILINQSNVTTEKYSYHSAQTSTKNNQVIGKIIDSKTKAPLSFVNIGFPHHARGTVSGENGEFELLFNENDPSDTLRISMIGYSSREIILSDLLKSLPEEAIELDEKIESLDEVVVFAKGLKEKVLGNKTESKFISTGFSYDQLGAEMGIKVKVKKSPTFVDALNFHVSYNRLSAKSIFRVNFYSLNNGKPGKNILRENIFVEIHPKQTGLITVDLIPFDIILQEDTYVTLEWVKNEGINKKGEAIFFSLGILNNGTIYKPSSQASFKKHSSLGVGFNLNVRQ